MPPPDRPPRRSRPHPARDRALAALLRAFAGVLARFSWRSSQAIGRRLGALGPWVARRDWRRALAHLAIAFPEVAAAERRAIARRSFRHLGETLTEVLWAIGRPRAATAEHIAIEGWENLEAARREGRALVVVSGHVGAWELLHLAMAQAGAPLSVIARPIEEPALDRLLVDARSHFGTETIARGSPEAARQMLRAGRGGGAIGLMIDQDTPVEGDWVPFFGRLAYTPTAAAALARRLRAPILPVVIHRQADGDHRLVMEPHLVVGDRDDRAITALLTARIEAWIRERPEQWVWMHRRWRRRPPEEPRAAAAPGSPPPEPPGPRTRPATPTPTSTLKATSTSTSTFALVLLPALVAAALAGWACGGGGGATSADPWRRVDLLALEPRVESAPPNRPPVARAVTTYLGAAEVRDLTRVPEEQRRHFPEVSAGQVRALLLSHRTTIAYRLTLGATPFLRFTPLAGATGAVHRVAVRPVDGPGADRDLKGGSGSGGGGGGSDGAAAAGREVEVHRGVVAPDGPFAPPVVEIDLAAWAGRTIDLVLSSEGWNPRAAGGRPESSWAGLQVWHRAGPASRPRRDRRPNIVLLGLDTLRADFVGPRRDGRPTLTPALDRLAAEGASWSAAYSTFNSTNPSFASIFTGLYGTHHQVYDLQTRLAPEHRTLAEILRDAGYRTLAVFAASHLGDHASGLGQGFETSFTASRHLAAEWAAEQAMDWIAAVDDSGGDRPFFAFVHFFDPHTPHVPPRPYAEGQRPDGAPGLDREATASVRRFGPPGPRAFDEGVLAGHRDLYAGEVAYLDRQVGRLVAFLEGRGLLETTVVAAVGDHGENLDEHGIRYRHIGLWESTTHVPLIVRWPAAPAGAGPGAGGERGRRHAGLVQTLDLFPTLLAAAGVAAPPSDGIDLRELTGDGRAGRAAVFAEHAGRLGETVRTRDHRLTLQHHPAIPGTVFLYRTREDPGEERNLAGAGDPEEERLRRLLAAWKALPRRGPATAPRPADLTSEQLDQLRALGYL